MPRPIKVLELRSVRGTGGGPEKTILFGTARTDPSRFKVTVCYLRDGRDADFSMDDRARALGIDYVEINERHSIDPSIWSQAKAIADRGRFDIVHAHDYKTDLLAWLLAKRRPVAALATVHGWFGQDTVRERFYYAADKRLLKSFRRIISVSGALRDELVTAGCEPGRIVVIPNGIDHTRFQHDASLREPARRDLGIAPGELVVGAVGRLERQKRFDLLMEAVAALRRTQPSLTLVIAGDGSLADELRAHAARLGLGDRCRLLGHRTDVIKLHHAFDLFVQASEDEGSPNVVLEAMSLETPVVATAAGGTADLIEDGVHGLIVTPGDLNALTNALRRAIEEPSATRSRAASARKRVESEFSFARRMERVEEMYVNLLRESGLR